MTTEPQSLAFYASGLLGAPLLLGVIARTKAFFAGRRGPPLLQVYYDCAKLLRKGAVYSRTTTWVFRAGPLVGLAAVGVAAAAVPGGSGQALLAFEGDFILMAALLGLLRLFTVLAALDTGSPFEGMGASREVWISALAEPALFLAFAALARVTGHVSLSGILGTLSLSTWARSGAVLALVAAALLAVLLAENARIPVDDPNTHLELTMIHEVMVLDHGGPDLGFILYGAALKFWVLSALLVGLVLPVRLDDPWLEGALAWAGLLVLAVGVGLIESCMARLRLVRIPQLLVGADALALIALALVLR